MNYCSRRDGPGKPFAAHCPRVHRAKEWRWQQPPGRQAGGVTLFTGILILVLLTGLLLYASRVSVMEQRVSGNEVRYKAAFNAAESGLEHAREWFLANQILVNSDDDDLLPDGTGGWLSATEGRWRKCSEYTSDFDSETDPVELAHPCRAEPSAARRAGSYFYYWDDPDDASDDPYEVKLDTGGFLSATEQVNVRALMCLLVVDFDAATPVSACDSTGATASGIHYMITLMARGESDCSPDGCTGEALITFPLANTALFGGDPPDVPLTTATTFPPTGDAEVAANPNAAGLGVPLSVWANNNTECPAGPALVGSGSWATCELQEWYGVDYVPDDFRCPTAGCSCSKRESLSYTQSGELQIGIDIWVDDNFPCDLIEFFFGIPKSRYQTMRSAAKLLNSCDSLGPESHGIYWISGPDCTIQNKVIGSAKAPVVLLSAASTTWLNGNAELFGVLFVSNIEDPDAILRGAGTNIFYGAVIVDTTVQNFAGTFQVVYNESILARAAGFGGLKKMTGGWTDSPLDWH